MKKKYKKVKKALKEEEGTGSPYDGYTVKDHKRDMKAHKRTQPKKSIFEKAHGRANKKVNKALDDADFENATPEVYQRTVDKVTKRLKKKKRAGTGNHPLNR